MRRITWDANDKDPLEDMSYDELRETLEQLRRFTEASEGAGDAAGNGEPPGKPVH